jgi:hypothetical protein
VGKLPPSPPFARARTLGPPRRAWAVEGTTHTPPPRSSGASIGAPCSCTTSAPHARKARLLPRRAASHSTCWPVLSRPGSGAGKADQFSSRPAGGLEGETGEPKSGSISPPALSCSPARARTRVSAPSSIPLGRATIPVSIGRGRGCGCTNLARPGRGLPPRAGSRQRPPPNHGLCSRRRPQGRLAWFAPPSPPD